MFICALVLYNSSPLGCAFLTTATGTLARIVPFLPLVTVIFTFAFDIFYLISF